jgi:hypothetical protein
MHKNNFQMSSTIKLLTLVILVAPYVVFAQTWEEAAPFPGEARHHPVTFSIDGVGYLVTGSTNTKDFYRYDPVADAWERIFVCCHLRWERLYGFR